MSVLPKSGPGGIVAKSIWLRAFRCARSCRRWLRPENDCGDLGAYSTVVHGGKTYDLNVVAIQDPNCGSDGCLTDYLLATGWKKTSTIKAGTVCAVVGSDGPFCHVVLGVGDNICDAHNSAACA